MIKVECIACKGPYELDEKRLPPSGLKMRCPKCGSVFQVHPDGRVTEPPAKKNTMMGTGGLVPPPPRVPAPPPPSAGDDESDLPAAKKPNAPALPPPVPPPPAAMFDDDLDLPAPRAPGASAGEIDLPAPRRPGASAGEIDLPAPRKPVGAMDDIDLPAPRRAGGTAGEIDLPAPRSAKPASSPSFGDDDLPAPKRPAPPKPPGGAAAALAAAAADADLPIVRGLTPAPGSRAALGGDADLPAVRGGPPAPPRGALAQGLAAAAAAARPAPHRPKESVKPALADGGRNPFEDLDAEQSVPGAKRPSFPGGKFGLDDDLPAPRKAAAPSFDLDLPAPKRGGAAGLDLDLPAPKSRGAGGFDLDLPAPKSGGSGRDADLPAPKGFDLDLPAPKAGGFDLDLPVPKAHSGAGIPDLDLPTPRRGGGVVDLPAPAGNTDLPAVSGGRLDLPAPRGLADLPVPRAGGFSDPPPSGRAPGFGDLELPVPATRGATAVRPDAAQPPLGDLDLGSLRPPAQAHAPLGHGEVHLPDAGDGEGGMEFADIPQSEQASEPPRTSGPGLQTTEREAVRPVARAPTKAGPPRRSKVIPIAIVTVVALAAAGGALTFTPYGPFGYYAIEQHLPGAGEPSTIARVVAEADALALRDTFSDSSAALEQLATARRAAGLSRRLLARSLVHESIFAVRFGDTSGAARAAAIRQRLEERDVSNADVALALAADDVRQGRGAGVAARIATARATAPEDPFVDLVEAEAALAEGDESSALQAFQAALAHGGGAAAQWGIARALLAGDGDETATLTAIDATLAAWPSHGDALAERARIHARAGEEEAALTLLRRVVGAEPFEDGVTLVSYPALRADAWTQLGEIHESRGRLHQASEAYDEAISADGTRVAALLGAGRVILRDRPADALTRFESVIGRADAETLTTATGRTARDDARLGASRAMLDLDRVQEATGTLLALATERPDDAEVLRWLGRSEELLDEHEAAEQHFREAIALSPSTFDGYLFLARLYGDVHRDSDAVAVLDSARSAVAEGPSMRESLGVYELGLNRLDQAVVELSRAIELDPALPGARFSLGVAYRRMGRLDDARIAFERLAELDPGHPGLALERGLLFEARGESDRAVIFYTEALEATPDDAELLLRLGAAQVGAGLLDDAGTTLERVQRALPASAEAEHFVGRIAFARGNYPEALQHLDRAIELDGTRGEFYVYAGWAALETGSLGRALERAEDALERDPSLGDAYWIRGTVRLRQRAVRDALGDLEHALVLRPGRIEAIAAIGECYDQLRQLGPAIDAYTRAVAANDAHGEWWYRLGTLQLDADRAHDAVRSLSRAALLGDAMATRPIWLADSHRLLGDSLRLTGERASAIEHYQRYLDVAEPSAIDRADVRAALMDLGAIPHH